MIRNILLVEYDVPTIDSIKEALSSPVFNIIEAAEGEEAKSILKEEKFDLVITAAMLPKFHGFNLALHVATHFPGTKIIIISGIYKGDDTRQKAISQYKADDFIEKPIDKRFFRARVLEILGLTEKDLQKHLAMSTVKIPLVDTTKIPIMRKTPDQKRILSSKDIFGDLIDREEEAAKYEISLGEEAEENQGEKIERERDQGKTEESPVTRIPTNMKTSTPGTGSAAFTRPARKKPDNLATQKFEIDIDSLVKPEKRIKDDKKFKKIEEEISKKFEDTLSGLGLANKKMDVGAATQKIEIIDEQEFKDQVRKIEKSRDRVEFETIKIELPAVKPDEDENEVGDYEILGQIARGGMAEIYKAKKKGVKGFEKIIALKKILSGYGEDLKYIEMFVDEAKIAAELSHPNIVQIYDLGKKDDFYFIAMEYVSGRDLRLILRKLAELKRLLPEELALHLILKVLAALNYAHSARDSKGKHLEIVHRDISPPNILVSFDGNVKLTDFGVSKATTRMHQTVSGALKGKLLYMSPEQACSDSDIDYRSDLYSTGIILFELITGKKLFMDSSDLLVLKKVQQGEIIKPGEIKKDISPAIEYIILKSLRKDKDKRYQDAAEMMKDIETYLMNNYERAADAVHLSHFLYGIFKDDIVKEKIDIDLKPLPYQVKRISRGEPTLLETLPGDIEETWKTDAGVQPPEIDLEQEEGFETIIEIDLDKEKEEEPEKEVVQSTHFSMFENTGQSSNKKRFLLWFIILAAVGIAAFVLITIL
ncbi:MAG: protein kinase [Candidatus Aminicenantes bacterium]|nr:protein kinase [Candidatus Aminicenantes bacterium]